MSNVRVELSYQDENGYTVKIGGSIFESAPGLYDWWMVYKLPAHVRLGGDIPYSPPAPFAEALRALLTQLEKDTLWCVDK